MKVLPAATMPDAAPAESSRRVQDIVFLGAFSPASLTFARSCREMGVAVHLLTPRSPGHSQPHAPRCFASAGTIDVRSVGTVEGLQCVAAFVRAAQATAIVSLAETHCLWLAENRAFFETSCTVLVPAVASLQRLESKLAQAELARRAGFEVLPTFAIRAEADITRIGPEQYPLCLRPATRESVSPPFKVAAAQSPDELRTWVRNAWALRGELIAQPFKHLPNAVLHGTSLENGEVAAADLFVADRKFEGLALRLRRLKLPESLREAQRQFSRAANLSGAYHFDLLYSPSDGRFFFLEVNARFGGTTDKVWRFGVNEPYNCLHAYGLNPPRLPPVRRSARSVVNKRAILKHLLTVLRHRQASWDYPQESRGRAFLRSMADLMVARDSIWDSSDLSGTLAFHLQPRDQ